MKMSKRIYALSALVASMWALPIAAKTDMNALTGELEIMSSILQTALKQDNQRGSLSIRDIDYTYLQDQGVVFKMTMNHYGYRQVFAFIDGHPSVPVAPIAPNVFHLKDGDIDIRIDEDEIEDAVEEAMEQAEYLSQESISKIRSLGEKLRELSWEERDYQRRRRDLEFEKSNSDNERKADIEEQLSELNAELKKIQLKRTEVERYKTKTETERQALVKQRKEAAAHERKGFLTSFEQNLGQVLCRYGAGLKALDDKEHVNFVLSDFDSSNRRAQQSSQDRVYVFKHSDIQACVKDKINQERLLQNGQVYGF
ncbi:hypothetical protein FX988_03621 [Paraglaciecola mesophila]|uniref:Uncharacterized protein n=1 Tax=Paraglaciecola mesophila TaxID=197222 RepID=A0A857JQC2_9ALTE|nr:hypothetical protein [Paraglaciecola mesophila]QHJ13360.1 hypothetical protein FX988_03621 [Paraglaciecola mesophila]